MKKIFTLLLASVMVLGSICNVNAATMTASQFLELCDTLNRPIDVPIYVQGKLDGGTYANSVTGRVGNGAVFCSVLDMTNVKAKVNKIFTEGEAALSDADLAELKNLSVTGQFTVTAEWTGVTAPADVTDGNLAGFTFDGVASSTIFEEKAITRNMLKPNKVEIKIDVKSTVKTGDLSGLPDEIMLEHDGFNITSDGEMIGTITGWTKVHYTSGGKDYDITYNFTTDSDHVMIVPIRVKPNFSGGTTITEKHTLTYISFDGIEHEVETHSKGKNVILDEIPVREGYIFTGWYSDPECTQKITDVKMTEDITVYAGWLKEAHPVPDKLNGDDHFAYVIGYPDGTVRPENNISRAEVTSIFFRLLKDEVRDGNLTSVNVFDDVNEGDWYNAAVSTMAKLGIVNGRTKTAFEPDEFITRAEFTAICARFDDFETELSHSFTDITGHWAESYINEATVYGWVNGYEDGTFRPDIFITRAEAMTLINRVLNRVPETKEDLLDGMIEWSDNSNDSEWYYLAVQEATNSHECEHKNSVYEKWTKVTEARDWSEYEK